MENIKEKQDKDDKLTQSTVTHPTWYSHKTINDVEDILCYTKPGDNAANWRIALPENLIVPTIKWYHQVTGHPGSKRLYHSGGAREVPLRMVFIILEYYCDLSFLLFHVERVTS